DWCIRLRCRPERLKCVLALWAIILIERHGHVLPELSTAYAALRNRIVIGNASGDVRPSVGPILSREVTGVKPQPRHRDTPWPRGWLLWWSIWVGISLALCGFGPPKLIDREFAPTQRLTVGELRAWAN